MTSRHLAIDAAQAGATLAAVLRPLEPGRSWAQARRLIETRHARINGDLCLDPARRVKEGDAVEILAEPSPKARPLGDGILRYLDEHIVVVEKPAGMNSMRHPAERSWSQRRKALSPTLEDMVPPLIAARESRQTKGRPPRLRVVHRLDKETSGLLVFARTVTAERGLGEQFRAHSVMRRYLAVVPGTLSPRTISTRLIRDRGDGRRGSTPIREAGKQAVTHVEVGERLTGYTLLVCRLETGRTHQIRIHLSELGHPICGEKVYNRKSGEAPRPDDSGAPRLALHAAELGLTHPHSGEVLHWEMALPDDLRGFVERLRDPASGVASAPRARERET